MRCSATEIPGVVVVDVEARSDERGSFARLFCPEEFAVAGHPFQPVQSSLSRNPHLGTLRGLHHQPAPHAEVKLVRCVRGRIFDVAVDLRPASPAFRRWTATELSAENVRALLIPEGGARLHAIAPLLAAYKIDTTKVKILGSALWTDPTLATEPTLAGAWFAAPPAGAWTAFAQRYRATFGTDPPRLASLAYDAVNMARARALLAGRPLADLPPEAMALRGSRARTAPPEDEEA